MSASVLRLLAGLLLGLAILAGNVRGAERMVTEVIAIGYRDAGEVVTMLRPLVPPPGTVTHLGNQLIVKTTPENMGEIRRLLKSIDRAPANLLISVRHAADEEVRRDLAEAFAEVNRGGVSASAGSEGRGGRGLSVSGGDDDVSGSARAVQENTAQSTRASQRVRVLEGQTAFIATGEERPLSQQSTIVQNGRVVVQQGTVYARAESGFYVRPRLTGDRVILDIMPADNRFDGTRIETREVSTSVSGRLGKWMQIGGVSESGSQTRKGIGSVERRDKSSSYSVYVKVTKISD